MAVSTTIANGAALPIGGGTLAGNTSVSFSSVGGTASLTANNTDNSNTTSHAALIASVGGTNGGSPYLGLNIPGGVSWCVGAVNTNGDTFTIARGTDIAGGSSANRFEIDNSATNIATTMYFGVGITVFGQYSAAAAAHISRRNVNDGSWEIQGGNATQNGGSIVMYGSGHLTNAGKVQLITGNTSALTVFSSAKVLINSGLCVGNSAAATVAVGTLAAKIQVFDGSQVSLGFIPVYATIT